MESPITPMSMSSPPRVAYETPLKSPPMSVEDTLMTDGSDSPSSYSIESIRHTKSTVQDARAMQRMGRAQQLIRHFRLFSTVCFVAIATANWELTIFTVNQGLYAGRAALVWSYIWNFFGFVPIILSMAEMSSMAPIAGAQYHWVSEFSSSKWQKPLSYFTGWMSTLAWQAGNAQGLFLTGTLIQTLIYVNDTHYGSPSWQGTLLIIACAVVTLLLNIYGNKYLPYAQNVLFTLHCLLYLCFIVPVWVLSPRVSAKEVFTDFQNIGNWPNLPIGVLASQLSGIAGMTGVDAAAHMSEEIKDAGRNVPTAMVYSYLINAILSIPATITLSFAITDLHEALNKGTMYPAIWVLKQSWSVGWTSAFVAAVVTLLFCSNVSYLAAVARDLFAFARDDGLPFSKWVAKVHPKHQVPANALIVSNVVASGLSLIYLGSSTAYYALTSLFVVAILQCYMFSIGSILWRRVCYPDSLPPARWSLGRYGILTNILAMVYVIWAFFWSFWPQGYKWTPNNFNWSSVIFVGVTLCSAVLYFFQARFIYTGPVVLIERPRSSASQRTS